MADLQGPKLRCGLFESGSATLKDGEDFCFDLDESPGNSQRVCLPHKEIFEALVVDSILLIDVGHYESEQYTKNLLFDILTKKFPNFAIALAKTNTNPVKYG